MRLSLSIWLTIKHQNIELAKNKYNIDFLLLVKAK